MRPGAPSSGPQSIQGDVLILVTTACGANGADDVAAPDGPVTTQAPPLEPARAATDLLDVVLHQVIKQVGNYAEVYDRHLTPLGVERGLNAFYTDGGLLRAPPAR